MFKSGDHIVYGNLGVCTVKDCVTRKFEGLDEAHPYYVLEPLYQAGVLYVPADNPKISLRAVLSADEVNDLIDAMPTMDGEVFHSRSAQELAAHYEQALKSHNARDLAALALSIHNKKQSLARQNRKFGRVDEHFMRQAEDSLYGEFAVSLGIPRDQVPGYIANRIEGVRG